MRMQTMTKAARLRQILFSPQTEFILEAHNGISARIVEEAGFAGIWGSGLAMSAQFAVRDNNELSWTQVVDMLEFMSDATSIPILLDGDTGYGDFNNMRRLVRKLEQRDVAGVCIEDKLFPKTNSFIQGERQPLADIEEFCGKIKSGKDHQLDDNFSIVARVEALIAGWGLEEALKRAEAYRLAGADAILMHSKKSRPDEILAFAKEWDNRAPLVIVPTKYYSTPTDVFREAGISLVIWANHMMRANITAMQSVSAEIFSSQSLVNSEGRIASVSEIFRLQGADELLEAEKLYSRSSRAAGSALILAASRGDNLDELTTDRPKAMIPVAGKPVLRRLVEKFKRQGINDISVVAGYAHEAIDKGGLELILNPDWETSGELSSMLQAKDKIMDDLILVYGDLLFRSYILHNLLDWDSSDLIIVVDSSEIEPLGISQKDLVWCSSPDNRAMYQQQVALEHISTGAESGWKERKADGRWIGMLRSHGEGTKKISTALETLSNTANFTQLGLPDLLNFLIGQGERVQVMYINGHWLDLNNLADLERANDFAQGYQT